MSFTSGLDRLISKVAQKGPNARIAKTLEGVETIRVAASFHALPALARDSFRSSASAVSDRTAPAAVQILEQLNYVAGDMHGTVREAFDNRFRNAYGIKWGDSWGVMTK
jgi:hypothetical protein